MDRREFVRRAAMFGGGVAALGPLQAFAARTAEAGGRVQTVGYGELLPKGDLMLPPGFNYQVISRQGLPQRDGTPTPPLFDAMGAFPGQDGTTILLRNHENPWPTRGADIPVVVVGGPPYDPLALGGVSKLVVRREKAGKNEDGDHLYTYEVVDSFNILGGTSNNCAGGVLPWHKWVTCEEAVFRSAGIKHGYVFEVDAFADAAVPAHPVPAAGRFVHEAACWRAGVLYMTEDRSINRDRTRGACFYRYTPDHVPGRSGNLAETTGVLEALKLKHEFRANMNVGRVPGVPYDVEWVTVDDPDHEDDTDERLDRAPRFTPTRIQAQDKGAAMFDRQEGMWDGPGESKVYFACTEGGEQDLGQIWEYDPGREVITLLYESHSAADLANPDNLAVVKQTGDVFICEDSDEPVQHIRGLTQEGEIYDFARTVTNESEFCGAVFDPDGQTLYVNQQGSRRARRSDPVEGSPGSRAVTYAIYGPFEKREGSSSKSFGNGPPASPDDSGRGRGRHDDSEPGD